MLYFFMLEISFSLIALIVTSPTIWILLAAVASSCFVTRASRLRFSTDKSVPRPAISKFALESVALAALPLIIVTVGAAFWRTWETDPPHQFEALLLNSLNALLLLQAAALVVFIWRNCGRPAAAAIVSVTATLWSLGAQFASTMAITGNWL